MGQQPVPFQPVDAAVQALAAPVGELDQEPRHVCRIVTSGRARRTLLGGRLVATGLQEALDHRALDAGVDIVGRYG